MNQQPTAEQIAAARILLQASNVPVNEAPVGDVKSSGSPAEILHNQKCNPNHKNYDPDYAKQHSKKKIRKVRIKEDPKCSPKSDSYDRDFHEMTVKKRERAQKISGEFNLPTRKSIHLDPELFKSLLRNGEKVSHSGYNDDYLEYEVDCKLSYTTAVEIKGDGILMSQIQIRTLPIHHLQQALEMKDRNGQYSRLLKIAGLVKSREHWIGIYCNLVALEMQEENQDASE